MILTWIVFGLAAGAAMAAIIAYWNEIVDWAKGIVSKGAKYAKLAINSIKGELIPELRSLFKGRPEKETGTPKSMTPEEIRQWGKEVGLSEGEIEDLINGKTIFMDVD